MPAPYSLTASEHTSDSYYRAVSVYADQWIAQARALLAGPVGKYRAFLANQGLEVCSFEEAAFEMLVLGVLLQEHGAQALDMPGLPAWLLARLIEAQDRLPVPAVEKPAKAARGLIQGLTQPEQPDPTPVDLKPFRGEAEDLVNRLAAWLRSADMAAQAVRMERWSAYIDSLEEQSAQAILARCLLLAEEFTESSQAVFNEYTQNSREFAEQMAGCSRWRYDAPLVTRSPVEYHLGMLGTEILTRAYRPAFLSTRRKIVIMPDCLCARSRRAETQDQECQATRTDLGGKCQGCTPACQVNQVTRLGEKYGFEAYILPDEYRGIGLGSCSRLVDVGVVGLSCVLTNWDAGWQVRDAGVPCQGLLLDFPGCKNHWHEQGLPTRSNLKKLLDLLGV